MFYKNITFSAPKEYLEIDDTPPIPTKLNIPKWFKDLDHTPLDKTIKGCMPFLDTLTSGYLLRLPQDLYINHISGDQQNSYLKPSLAIDNQKEYKIRFSLNLNIGNDSHPTKQLAGSPILQKNGNLFIYKILNPYIINTPPGYSCLFIPPLNNADDRFSIIPAIVDTDVYNLYINFPFYVNSDKYPTLRCVLEKGLPYVQIIPFKRDNWEMKIKEIDFKKPLQNLFHYNFKAIYKYKNKFWNKKTWR